MSTAGPPVLGWAGRYRRDYPRTATLQAAARAAGFEIVDAWGRNAVVTAVRTFRAIRRSGVQAVVVGYPGYRTLPLVAAAARLRRVPVVFDAFVSLYETRVTEREEARPRSLRALAYRLGERLAWRMSTTVVLDTRQHAAFVVRSGGLDGDKVTWVPLAPDLSTMTPCGQASEHDLVASYGNFSALHGAPVMAAAAGHLAAMGSPVRLVVAGDGPQFGVTATAAAAGPTRLELPGRLPLGDVRALLCRSAFCLGIFGTSEKAGRVVPNKVFDAMALGRPVITRDGPAVRDVLEGAPEGLVLVPAGDARALAEAVAGLHARPPEELRRMGEDVRAFVTDRFGPTALAARFGEVIDAATRAR